MRKKVLCGPDTFGRNYSYPSTSITRKVAKMEKFPLVHNSSFCWKHEAFFPGSPTITKKHLLTYPNLNVYSNAFTSSLTWYIEITRPLQYQRLFEKRRISFQYWLLTELRPHLAFLICWNESPFFKRSQLFISSFFRVKCNFGRILLHETYCWKQSFLKNLPKEYNNTRKKNSTKSTQSKFWG